MFNSQSSSCMSSLLLLVPYTEHVVWLREAVTSDDIFVFVHCVLRGGEVELGVVEGLQSGLLSNQSQPDVVKPEHSGVVAGVVHLNQGVT